MSWEFQLVAGPFSFTEGPAWDGEAVLFTDIPNHRIMRYDPRTDKCEEYITNTGGTNGLMFDANGVLYGCAGDDRAIVRFRPDGSKEIVADRFEGKRLNSPNDLAFDPLGRLWFTDPRYGSRRDDLELDHESVYRLDPQPDGGWSLHRVTFDTTKPNGILITPQMDRLYVAQSDPGEGAARELRAYPVADDGSLGPYEVLHNFYPHRGIDGMCLDEEGNIVATAGWKQSGPGPMIYVFAPNGRVLETHPIDAHPTNCTWGDDDLRTLYVTASGCLFRARTHRRGYLVYPR